MDIDGELEDTEGVKESKTNYAKQKTEVEFNSEKISEKKVIALIQKLGYSAEKEDKSL